MNNTALNAKGYDSSIRNQVDNPFLYFINPFNFSDTSICVKACPNETVIITDHARAKCLYGYQPTDAASFARLVKQGVCVAFTYKTRSVRNR
jgi:hypothetical protein